MKKLKKWQKVVVGVLMALIVVVGGLRIFKRPILSAVLNDEEYMVFDCCCKMRRIIEHENFYIDTFNLMYYTDFKHVGSDRTGVVVYSVNKNEAAFCYAEYQDDITFFYPSLSIAQQNIPDGYFVDWDVINLKSDKYKVLSDAVLDVYNDRVVVHSGFLQDSNVTYDGEDREMIESSFEEHREIRGLKHWIINLYSY